MSLTRGSVVCLKHQRGLIPLIYQGNSNYSSDSKAFNLTAMKRGTGGRSSFNGVVATVFGATGFMGRYVCNKLGKIGTQLVIPYRGDFYDAQPLKVCGDLGQVLFFPYNLRDEKSIETAMKYSNVVINLIGRDWETKSFKFEDVHVTGPATIARIAKRLGIEKFIHVSALNAVDRPTPNILKTGSKYLASKYRGEHAVLNEFPEAVIFRPADVYGSEDRFLRYYSHFWRRQAHWLPMWKKGETAIKQPVFVSDVAAGIINAVKDPDSQGKIYQAVGPKRYKLSDLVDWIYLVMKKDKAWGYWRYDLRFDPFFQMKVSLTEKICPGWPIGNLHWERVEREYVTDTLQKGVPTLEDLGVTLTPIEDQAPWELKPYTYAIYHDRDLEDFGKRPPPPPVAPM